MPIKPIDYSLFSLKWSTSARSNQLIYNDIVWQGETSADEVSARKKLLDTQIRRLLANAAQPQTTIAVKNKTFYFLTEVREKDSQSGNFPVLSLLDNLLDLTISDEEAINYIRDYYVTNRREANDPHSLINQIILKIVITPPEVFSLFVNECIETWEQQPMHINALHERQNTLILYLAKENAKFKKFSMSEEAEQYVRRYYGVLDRFLINNHIPVFHAYSKPEIETLHLAQKRKLAKNGLYSDILSEETLEDEYPANSNDELVWTDIGLPPLATPRTESSSPTSFSSMFSRFGQFMSSSSSSLSGSPVPGRSPVSARSPSHNSLLSPIIGFYKERRGSSARVGIAPLSDVPTPVEKAEPAPIIIPTPVSIASNHVDADNDLPQIEVQFKPGWG